MTSTFADDAKRLFGTTNLYDLLQLQGTRKSRQNLSQDASRIVAESCNPVITAELEYPSTIDNHGLLALLEPMVFANFLFSVKKAFFKQSLQYHPDRCVEECAKKEATEKFQIISRAYAVLGDEQKRKLYDETGLLDDAEVSGDDADWMERWRVLFPEITVEDIDAFIKKYRVIAEVLAESGEEHTAIKESFIKNKGDMNKIMDEVIGLTYEDEDRVRKIIDKMIEKGELKATRYYAAEPAKRKEKRRKAAEKEAKEAEQVLRELKAKEGTTELKALIRKRQLDRDSFLDDLAAKYAKPSAKGKKKKKTAG
ncbi:unnamed protein product [Toxocara canis]|uniref:J domain-containing protein n=1 Tax=Toxocara canis TaxID=6265 RepID=A0A183UV03_TOXCA|nr:unnamed protein product [Toxocara canis]